MPARPDDHTQPIPAAPAPAPVGASASPPAAEPTTDAVVPDSPAATSRPSWWAGRTMVAAGALVVGLCVGAAAGATTAVALGSDDVPGAVTSQVGPDGVPGEFPGGRMGRGRPGDGTRLPDGTQLPDGSRLPGGGEDLLPGGGGSTAPDDANGTAPST